MSAVIAFLKNIWEIIRDFFWPPPDPADPAYDQALDAYNNYQNTSHNPEDLIRALEIFDTALRLRRLSRDQTELASLLVNYAVAIWSRYKAEPGADLDTRKRYLNDVIKFDEEARQLWRANPPSENRYPTLLANLANAYFELFYLDQPQEISALTRSLALNRELFNNSTYPEDNRHIAALHMGEALWCCYDLKAKTPNIQISDESQEKNEEETDAQRNRLDEAIAKFKESLKHAEKHDNAQIRVACYYFIAKAYDARNTLSKDAYDLDKAIDYNKKASTILANNDPRLKTCLYDLCVQLLRKYDSEKVTKTHSLLEEAKGIAQDNLPDSEFQKILDVVHNREHRKPTL